MTNKPTMIFMNKLKFVIAALFVVMGVQSSFAQAQVGLGIKAGLNFANVNATSPSATFGSRTGYHAGAFLKIKLTKLAIQPEVLFSQQGTTVKTSAASVEQTLSYVNIPVMVKFYLVSGLYLEAGPQFGFLTSAIAAGIDTKSFYNSADTSIGLGAGFDIKKLNINARYNIGLSEINKTVSASSPSAKNQVFQLSLGYQIFKIGK